MHCSSCGAAVVRDLTYCNRCGAKLSGGEIERVRPSDVLPGVLVPAMAFVFIVGLIAIIVLISMLRGADPSLAAFCRAFVVLAFLLMLALEGIFPALLWRRMKPPAAINDTERAEGPTTKELDIARERLLAEPLTSVTDHTTRAFDPVFREEQK
jgi:hypothetical protein